MSERVILAYSGGLDTSVAISWTGSDRILRAMRRSYRAERTSASSSACGRPSRMPPDPTGSCARCGGPIVPSAPRHHRARAGGHPACRQPNNNDQEGRAGRCCSVYRGRSSGSPVSSSQANSQTTTIRKVGRGGAARFTEEDHQEARSPAAKRTSTPISPYEPCRKSTLTSPDPGMFGFEPTAPTPAVLQSVHTSRAGNRP